MHAAWYEKNGPAADVIAIGEIASPRPGANQVLVRIVASGANPHDTKSRSGWSGRPMPAPRVIPHADGSGVIEAAGPGVDRARIGQRVWIFRADAARPGGGTAAEFAIVDAAHAVPLPNDVDFITAAGLGVPAITAHTAVLRDGPVSGTVALVQGGAGAVGQYAIQLARWGGARVVATARTPEKRALAKACGADMVVDHRSPHYTQEVIEFTGGKGVDRIIEVDFGANLEADLRMIAMNGIIASYSSTRVRHPVVDYYALASKGVTLHAVQGRHLTEGRRRHAVRDISALLSRGLLRHPEPAVFPLAQTAAAHELIEAGSDGKKAIIVIDAASARAPPA